MKVTGGLAKMINRTAPFMLAIAWLLTSTPALLAEEPAWRHATALVGEPTYPEGFRAVQLCQSGCTERRQAEPVVVGLV
jgi:hypothetical protein